MLQIPMFDILKIIDYQNTLNSWNALNPGTEQPKILSLYKYWDEIKLNQNAN